MRDNTFTPGPWGFNYENGVGITGPNTPNVSGPCVDKSLKYTIVTAPGLVAHRTLGIFPEQGDSSHEKNARLFYAAPDMYDALWEAIELSDRTLPPSGRTPECQRVYDLCRAALKRAEGDA